MDPDAERVMRQNGIAGCRYYFCNKFWIYGSSMRKVAEEYPDVKFEHATGYKSNDTNFANYGLRL